MILDVARRIVAVALVACALALSLTPDPAAGARPSASGPVPQRPMTAESGTMATGAGAGLFPDGADLAGVRLSGSTFGSGVLIFASGPASGTFQTVLAGTSLLGLPQNITVEGKVGAGARNADGSVTFRGSAIVDMGDGSVPSAGVPFSVTMTPGTLALVLGTTALPTQTLTGGSITIN